MWVVCAFTWAAHTSPYQNRTNLSPFCVSDPACLFVIHKDDSCLLQSSFHGCQSGHDRNAPTALEILHSRNPDLRGLREIGL